MNDEPLVYHYYEPPPPLPAGVQKGYLVISNGKPGPAKIADLVMLHDGEGGSVAASDGPLEFRDCEVVDGAKDQQP